MAKVPIAVAGEALGALYVDPDHPGMLYVRTAMSPAVWAEIPLLDAVQTLTNKTINSSMIGGSTALGPVAIAAPFIVLPSIYSANMTSALGPVMGQEVSFVETTGAGVWTGAITLPAGATLLDIIVNGDVLWTSQTSAVMDVGDVATPTGYFNQVNVKATDLLAGESISFAFAGGKAGAYIANAQVSPRYSATARVVNGIITKVGSSGTAGRTRMTVVYHSPVLADILLATKV